MNFHNMGLIPGRQPFPLRSLGADGGLPLQQHIFGRVAPGFLDFPGKICENRANHGA
jgi:hypothetical protein